MDRAFPPLADVTAFLYETVRSEARSLGERPSPQAGLNCSDCSTIHVICQCPLRVMSRHGVVSASCPLFSSKR